MTGTTRRMRLRRGRELAVAAVAAGCLLAAACGKKGNPLPPMRIIPNATTDLKVAQRGNQLVLRFAYPQTTTAGAKLPGLAAVEVNSSTENIGARRLSTLMERLLDEVSFDAPDMSGVSVKVDGEYVRRVLSGIVKDQDLSRYVL